jgi:hypothetical protein
MKNHSMKFQRIQQINLTSFQAFLAVMADSDFSWFFYFNGPFVRKDGARNKGAFKYGRDAMAKLKGAIMEQ